MGLWGHFQTIAVGIKIKFSLKTQNLTLKVVLKAKSKNILNNNSTVEMSV
jgi:hypothetical protein